MPTIHSTFSPKFDAALKTVLADDKVEKLEARKLRKVALEDLKTADKPAQLADAYSSKFESLGKKSADKVTGRYVATVAKEFTERADTQKASLALQSYLKSHATSLPKALKNIDVKGEFEVGSSMNRGIWLRIPVKDRAGYFETEQAASDLLKKLGKGELWVIT